MMLPRFAFTLSVAVQVLLVFHSSIASLPVVVGAKTTTSSINKEGEDTTSTSVLRPGRRGLKKSSQEVASSTAFGASDNEQHHILKKKEASKVVLSNAADQTMQEEVVLGDTHDYPPPDNINMIDEYDDDKNIRADFDPDKNFASELSDLTLPTKNAGITTRQLGQRKVVVYHGHWGTWGSWYGSGTGRWAACGAQLRVESPQGGGDDTAANGIKFRLCGLHSGKNWNSQWTVTPTQGRWGGWTGMKMCPRNKYIGAVRIRFEDKQGGGDDTALNGLQIFCVDKNWRGGSTITVHHGHWGSWKNWEYIVGTLVKQVQVRNEGPIIGDDTGLNGIALRVE